MTKKLQSNTGELGGSMVSVKCGFRLECFSTVMFFLTDIVAAFVFSVKKRRKKKPSEASALKGVSGLLGQRPHPKCYLNHFE